MSKFTKMKAKAENNINRDQAIVVEESKRMEAHNQQISLKGYAREVFNENRKLERMNINQSLAKAIYEFLTEQKDSVPAIEYFEKIYNGTSNGIISMGYGLTIDKDFRVTYTTPSDSVKNSDVERNDVIKPEEYFAFYSKPGFKEENSFYKENEYNRKIDVMKDKIFDLRRVNYLQKYLNKCREKILSSNKEKSL